MSALLTYEPVILLAIELTGGTRYVATRDYYYSGQKYRGCVLDFDIDQAMSDLFYGIGQPASMQIQLENVDDGVNQTWDEIAATEEFRGRWVRADRYDPVDGLQFLGYGRISETEIGDTVRINCSGHDPVFDTILPRHVITTDLFHATAVDLGMPVNLCFGLCRDVPLYNIRTDRTNGWHDYLLGYGTIEGLDETPASNLGVKREGRIVNSAEYSIHDGAAWIRGSGATVYAGYAFIRFTREQINFSGGMHRLTADVKGLELGGATCNRVFPTVIKNLLTNATWGLGQTADATSFTNAAAVISNANNFYCDGAVTRQQRADRILMDLLMPSRSWIERASDKEFEITVDQAASSVLNAGDGDGRYENCKITGGLRTISADQIVSKIRVHYDMRGK